MATEGPPPPPLRRAAVQSPWGSRAPEDKGKTAAASLEFGVQESRGTTNTALTRARTDRNRQRRRGSWWSPRSVGDDVQNTLLGVTSQMSKGSDPSRDSPSGRLGTGA